MTKNPLWRDVNSFFRDAFGGKAWKVLVDTGLACPHRNRTGGCVFCNEETLLPDLSGHSRDIADQVDLGRAALCRKYGRVDRMVVYFQRGTALAAPRETLDHWLRAAFSSPGVVAAALSARPENVTPEALAALRPWAEKGPLFIDMGLQSSSDATLARIGRGHGAGEFARAARGLASVPGLLCIAHLVVGLPGEDDGRIRESFRFLSGLPLHGVKIHHLQVLRGSALGREYEERPFPLQTPETFVRRLADGLEVLPPDLVIHRLQGDQAVRWVLAPAWHLRKDALVALLENEFRARGTRQGSRFRPPED